MTEMWIIRIISFLLGWFFLSYIRKCYQLSFTKERLKALRESYKSSIEKNYYYRNILCRTLIFSGNQREYYSDSVKEAVRYAMQKSHPDNGGKQEDFVKFRKLYEKIKQEDENG